MQIAETEASLARALMEFTDMILATDLTPEEFEDKKTGTFVAALQHLATLSTETTVHISPPAVYRAILDMGKVGVFKSEDEIFSLFMAIQSFEPRLLDTEALDQAASLIKRSHLQRSLKAVYYEAATRATKPGNDPVMEASRAISAIESLVRTGVNTGDCVVSMRDSVVQRLDDYAQMRATGRKILGLSTGFSSLDDITSGLQSARFYMLGGGYGGGKTSFSFQVATHIAMKENEPIAYALYEGSPKELAQKFLTQWFGVSSPLWRAGEAKDPGGRWKQSVLEELFKAGTHGKIEYLDRIDNIEMIEATGKTTREVEGILHQINHRREKEKKRPVAILFFDYIQLAPPSGKCDTREQEISRIGLDLKDISVRMQIPVWGITQLAGEKGDPAVKARESRALHGHCHSFWRIRLMTERVDDHCLQAEIQMEKNRDAASGGTLALIWDEMREAFRETDNRHIQPAAPTGASRPSVPVLSAEEGESPWTSIDLPPYGVH